MSLQVNLTGADLQRAYQDVLNQKEIDWALFTYEKGSNDLKLQSTGDGGLEELQDEFSDGRLVNRSPFTKPVLIVFSNQDTICIRPCEGPQRESDR
jgi:exonuclease V gamma subunit